MGRNHQHAMCTGCGFEKENDTNALALGKQHAKAHGHTVFWSQELTGKYTG